MTSMALCLSASLPPRLFFFFFNDTATTEIYTLSLHDALPISQSAGWRSRGNGGGATAAGAEMIPRSEEHTAELQSQSNIVCRLLLEKKKKHKHSHLSSHHPYPTTPPPHRTRVRARAHASTCAR